MRLLDLDPRWLMKDDKRIGFTFNGPLARGFRQSCFVFSPPTRDQWRIFEENLGDENEVQGCTPGTQWTIAGGIESADFATLSVSPSIDGSAGGEWHGFITNGQIVGGL